MGLINIFKPILLWVKGQWLENVNRTQLVANGKLVLQKSVPALNKSLLKITLQVSKSSIESALDEKRKGGTRGVVKLEFFRHYQTI